MNQEEANQALWKAVNVGDALATRAALVGGADANTTSYGVTPLFRAAGGNHPEVVRVLLKRGAAVNAEKCDETGRVKSGRTPLMCASSRAHGSPEHQEKTVRLLLEHGADVDAKDQDGETALMMASGNIVPLLLDAGADATIANKNGKTALMRPASPENARRLLERGADVNAVNKNGGTALMAAAEVGSMKTAALLLDHGAQVNATTGDGETALMMAAAAGSTETVALLLDRGADVNAANRRGETPLMKAAGADALETTRLLLDAGADVFAESREGGRARFLAELGPDKNQTLCDLLKAAEDARDLNTSLPQARVAPERHFEDLGKPDPQPARSNRPRL